ncbi:MAG: hypothetical protein EBS05_17695 [Proteobacteria bacterium]|nr:hypothetical protein [Pseudomonadota bacterium]NDF01594.1 hypothetical protein [Verrucomicrobiota bacterium]
MAWLVEYVFIAFIPMYLGFMIPICWRPKSLPYKLRLACALGCLSVSVRLASSSLFDAQNWFIVTLKSLVTADIAGMWHLFILVFPAAVIVSSMGWFIWSKMYEDVRPWCAGPPK